MKERCSDFSEGIVSLAEGRDDASASLHIETCAACARKLEQLRRIVSVRETPFFAAPEEVIRQAKALLPPSQVGRARALRSTLAWSGSRAAPQDFQVVVSAGSQEMRVMYTRSEQGWTVLARTPASDWSGIREGRRLESDSAGRFSFHCGDLSESGFELTGPEGEFEVPSAEELLSESR